MLSQGASARPRQLLAQSLKSLLLGPLHRHGADLQLICRLPERQALKDGEPQGCGLSCRQLIYQLLQRQIISGPSCFLLWAGQLIEQARLASGMAIKADVTKGALTLLMQPAWNAHQPHPIAQVMLQGT